MSSIVESNEEPWSSAQRSLGSQGSAKRKEGKTWLGMLDIRHWIPIFMCITLVILVVVVLVYFMDCPQEEWNACKSTEDETACANGDEPLPSEILFEQTGKTEEEVEQYCGEEEEDEDEDEEEEENVANELLPIDEQLHTEGVANQVVFRRRVADDEEWLVDGGGDDKNRNKRQQRNNEVQPGEHEYIKQNKLHASKKPSNKQRRYTNTTDGKSKHYNQVALQQQRDLWRTQLKQTNRRGYQQQQQQQPSPTFPQHNVSMEQARNENPFLNKNMKPALRLNNGEQRSQQQPLQKPQKMGSTARTTVSKQQGMVELERWVKQEVQLTYQKKDYTLGACERLWNKFKSVRDTWHVNNQDLERIVTKIVKGHPQMGIFDKLKMRNVMLQYKKNRGF